MRSVLINIFRRSPFEKLLKHADLIREVFPFFRLAFLSYLDETFEEFESCHNRINEIEHQGDAIKRNIRGHLPKSILLPMDSSQLLWYLREQDKVLDGTQDTVHWLSYRKPPVPEEIEDDLLFMVEKVGDVLKSIHPLVEAADKYFKSFSEHDRDEVKKAICKIRDYESESDIIERKVLSDILSYPFDNPISAFHLSRVVQHMGDISNHAENAADMMRAMIAR
ncbi:MAG: TIGR00153 family protein [Desulfoferrobacter sp.]